MSARAPEDIVGWHAHVYFDDATFDQAKALCEQASATFGISMGHMHRGPVGPHPTGSCQLTLRPEVFGDLIPWLGRHRNGLTVFIHPMTGDDLDDHTNGTIWMGTMPDLDLSIFDQASDGG